MLEGYQFLKITLCGKILSWMCREFLRIRQRKKKKNVDVPEELKKTVKQYTYGRAQNYTAEKVDFQSFYDFCGLVADVTVLLCGALPYFWNKASSCAQSFGLDSQNEVVCLVTH
eukprot:TRINITY_DN12215_c0_g4_i1.p2 TRINITY_DN12215_c0_g4~~TRINITY_DN12215_c0_g4_i1.p2  ORF type:complete len:114 (-),score=40.49 TRINITY_DN12215_c0_g4_i1:1108-1449(-)